MNERVVIPDTVFFEKLATKWVKEVEEAEGFRVFEMKPARIYILHTGRGKHEKPDPPDAA